MASDINKTSIASTVDSFINDLEKWVLTPSEALNASPASFIGLVSSTLAKTSAYSYFNMLMSKREMTPSTAILMKSLMRQLTSDKINDIYGTPSDITLILSYPESSIINAAVYDSASGKYKLTLNKGTKFRISDYPEFTLDYNIDIYVTRYFSKDGSVSNSIYAMYNVDDNEAGNIIKCNDPYVVSRNDIVIDNRKHFTMYIKAKQFERSYQLNEMSGEASNIDIQYSNSLMGFVVLYRPQGYSGYYEIPTYLEGEEFSDGLSYSLSNLNGSKSIRLKFSKLPDAFNPTNGTLKIVYYTTHGSDGNFELGQVDENTIGDLTMEYAQDISSEYQEALVNIVPTVSISGTAAENGTDAKTLEQVRTLVSEIGNGEIITPITIASEALKRGFTAKKQRHDLMAFEFMLTSFLKYDSNIVPTKMINGFYNFGDIDLDGESNSRIITPADIFRYDPTSQQYKFIKASNLESYSEYYEKYLVDPTTDYSFPYFIRVANGANMTVKVYDESINVTKPTRFTYLAPSVLDKASIMSMNAYRNPLSLDEETVEDDLTPVIGKDVYKLTFTVNASAAIVTHLSTLTDDEMSYVKFRVIVKDTTDNAMYAADIRPSECIYNGSTIICNCYLKTSSAILSNGKIKISDNSLKSIPFSSTQYSFYYIDGTVDVDLCVIFKELGENTRQASKFDSYLTDGEISNGYYMGVIYTVDDIILSKDMTDTININSDVKLSQPEYQIADEDIPDIYMENEYKKNGDEYVMEEQQITLPDGSTNTTNSFVLLHKAGETKQTRSGCVGSYNTLNSSGSWKWSRDKEISEEVYGDGDVLGDEAINAIIQWNNLVIFGGGYGRIGCYDIVTKKWYYYNDTTAYRGNDDTSGYVINNDGSAMGNSNIRGMTIVKGKGNVDVLIVYGDDGRVASCDLSSNTWKNYDASAGNNIAAFCNAGSAMGSEAIYASVTRVNSNGETIVVFGGGSGRMCSLNVSAEGNVWYGYNRERDVLKESLNVFKDYSWSDGKERNYKAILSMTKYMESAIYCTGINGICTIFDLSTGNISVLTDGSIVDNNVMYDCVINGNLFIIAGKNGYVASYNLVRSTWAKYNDKSGLCSDGYEMGNESIHAIMPFGVNIIFAGGLGRVCSYDTSSNTWEEYSDGSGLSNDGSFITNTISCMSYDTSEGDSLIYFGGSAGNITYKYRKGDYILDNEGKPIIKTGSTQICHLKGIPAYSRIFAVDNAFDSILKSYTDLSEKITAMSSIFVDGCGLHLGLKTTSGKSTSYYFINPKTNEKTYLDSLCIRLSIGVKFDAGVTSINKSHLIKSIKDNIVEYISNIQLNTNTSTIELNINDMLDYVKTEVPNIEYFEYYSFNNYDSSICQTIFYNRETTSDDNEYLSVETTINEDSSTIEERMVEFEPNIRVTVL